MFVLFAMVCPVGSVSRFSVVGFSGSRALRGVCVPVLRGACGAVGSGSVVAVGCAGGVDGFVRSFFGSRAVVFRVGSFGSGRGAFARRSVAVVEWVASRGGCWVSFPVGACPVGLVPSSSSRSCFAGFRSGSWSSLAFAVGLGVPCFVFLGRGAVGVPAWLRSCGGGWFVA